MSEDMTHKPSDFSGKARNPEWEQNLSRWLRTITEADRLQFLIGLLDYQFVVALQLAHKCLTERESFQTLLELGLRTANAYSIKFWLDCVVPRLGFRRSVRLLQHHLDTYPEGVAKALYYFMRRPEARTASAELDELLAAAQTRKIPVDRPETKSP